MGVLKDISKELLPICFSPDFNTLKDKVYTEKLELALKRITTYLGDKEFIVGTLTYADFVLYEILTIVGHIYPQSVTPKITAFISRFDNLPGIKQYL